MRAVLAPKKENTARRADVLVITPCSATKRQAAVLHADALHSGNQHAVEAEWLSRLRSVATAGPANAVYCGRAFGFALQAAKQLNADLGIVSAGLGYVTEHTEIPSYDLTLRAETAGSVRSRVTEEFAPDSWWRALQKGRFANSLLADARGRRLILMCLSREYALLVGDELEAMGASQDNIRIFGLNISSVLPRRLVKFVLPYDERLNFVSTNGTRVDFPQRALLHYASTICRPNANLEQDMRRVIRSLADVPSYPKRVQNRQTDGALKVRIKALIRQMGNRRVKILRHLRHVEKLSCEQARFSALFEAVQNEMGGRL